MHVGVGIPRGSDQFHQRPSDSLERRGYIIAQRQTGESVNGAGKLILGRRRGSVGWGIHK